MFNPVQFYEFGKSRGGIPNTFIGGVSASIGTAQLLATKLAIDVSRISNFSVVGADIQCKISGGNYSGSNSAFQSDNTITYFNDSEGLIVNMENRFLNKNSQLLWVNFPALKTVIDELFCVSVKISELILPELTTVTGVYAPFTDMSGVKKIEFPKLTSVNTTFADIFMYATSLQTLYIPLLTNLGSDSLRNGRILFNCPSILKIYANPALRTSNNGGVEGDLAYAISRGATVRYVDNLTKPNSITNLTSGTIFSTAIQLNFTHPSSTNTIDYYECYANGVFKNNITASGQDIRLLTANTSYQFTIVAVDVFYNKSVISNSLSASTNPTLVHLTGLISYYKLESDSNDSYGTNNGVNTAITYAAGKVGNAAVFNSNSAIININSFSGITTRASVSFWIKIDINTPISANSGLMYLNTSDQNTHYPFSDNNIYMSLLTSVRKTIGVGIITDKTAWHMVTVSANQDTNVWKFYQNETLVTTSTVGSLSMLSNIYFGKSRDAFYLKGSVDEVAIYNTDLTQTEITQLYNNGNGVTL